MKSPRNRPRSCSLRTAGRKDLKLRDARASLGAVTESGRDGSVSTRRNRWATWGLALAMLGFGLMAASAAEADARSDYLVRLLRTSEAFRVRAQAAISLGRVDASPEIVRALSEALRDEHASVRSAAASSLERLGDPSALDALRSRRRDSDSAARRAIASAIRTLERVARSGGGSRGSSGSSTPTPPPDSGADARFYVAIGEPASNDGAVDDATLRNTQGFLERQVATVDGVQVAPRDESNAAANRAIRRGRMTGFFIDSSVVSLGEEGGGTRAVVSLILATYPGRDMRAILRGAATVPGSTGPSAERTALEGAFHGALRRLPQAMEASANR